MRKRNKPYVLIAIVVIMLSIVGFWNLKSVFANASNNPEAPPSGLSAPQPVDNDKGEMGKALQNTMGSSSSPSMKGVKPPTNPDHPIVANPDQPPQKPMPKDSDIGRLTDKPGARK